MKDILNLENQIFFRSIDIGFIFLYRKLEHENIYKITLYVCRKVLLQGNGFVKT